MQREPTSFESVPLSTSALVLPKFPNSTRIHVLTPHTQPESLIMQRALRSLIKLPLQPPNLLTVCLNDEVLNCT